MMGPMRHLLVLALLTGCARNPDAATDASTDDRDASTDPEDSAGLPDPGLDPLEITAEISEYVSTVIRVRWRTESVTAGYVQFGEDDTYRLITPATEAGTDHEVLLLGMTADTEVHFRVVTTSDTGETPSADLTITTGSLPPGLYPMRTTGTSSWSGYQVVPLQGASFAVTILDAWGRYIWYHQLESRGNLMRAFLTHDGAEVVYCLAGGQESLDEGKIVWVSMDGGTVRELPLPNVDHDIIELPDGTIGAIVVVGNDDGSDRLADSIVELSADGTLTTRFNAWDHWDPDALGIPTGEHNWTHANALDYDPAEDAYYLSMKTPSSLAKIDRATGTVVWGMNGKLNEFSFADGTPLDLHHQFEVLDGSLLFFENGPVARTYSRAVEITFDADARTAVETWEYIRDPEVHVYAKGDVHRFDDGITQVTWSTAGEIQQVDPAGEVVWSLNLDLGQVFTFVQPVVSLYGE